MQEEPAIPSPKSSSFQDERTARSLDGPSGMWSADRPEVGVILGSGLGAAADRLLDGGGKTIGFPQIPDMPIPQVEGHSGRLVLGRIGRCSVAMLQGRVHHYEGHSLEAIVFGTRLLIHLGIRTLILTNASGGISEQFAPGDLMLIKSHLRPLAAADLNLGQVLPVLTEPGAITARLDSCLWNPHLRSLARTIPTNLRIHEGVYAMMPGPAYETPAEIRMMRSLGADAVGMSTVPEAIFAAARGIRVLGVSCITNIAAGLSGKSLSHEDVTATASTIDAPFSDWLWNLVKCCE